MACFDQNIPPSYTSNYPKDISLKLF